MSRVKGPALQTLKQLKKLVSNQLRRVAISTQLEDGARAKLVVDLARVLSDLIEKTDGDEQLTRMEAAVEKLKKGSAGNVPLFLPTETKETK